MRGTSDEKGPRQEQEWNKDGVQQALDGSHCVEEGLLGVGEERWRGMYGCWLVPCKSISITWEERPEQERSHRNGNKKIRP